jgi:hypothetical protein
MAERRWLTEFEVLEDLVFLCTRELVDRLAVLRILDNRKVAEFGVLVVCAQVSLPVKDLVYFCALVRTKYLHTAVEEVDVRYLRSDLFMSEPARTPHKEFQGDLLPQVEIRAVIDMILAVQTGAAGEQLPEKHRH